MTIETLELIVELASERLDRWLAEQLPNLSRSRLQKLIEQGQLQINNHICLEKKHHLKSGQWCRLVGCEKAYN